MVKIFQLRQPKLLYLSNIGTPIRISRKEAGGIHLDEVDRLPPTLKVTYFDIFCFFFSTATYVLDIVTDLAVACIHYHFTRYFAALLIFTLSIIPTVFLNTVSLLWSKDDMKLARKSMHKSSLSKSRTFCITAHVFQLGPIMWYVRAISSGIKFRYADDERMKQRLYCEMVMADRDASLLRFFEAFIESMPQVLVQGYIFLGVYNELKDDQQLLLTAYFQIFSLLCSLTSSCWSISIQHRNLRIARPDKDNMTIMETCLQFLWRFFTISARYTCLVVFAVAFHHWIFIFIFIHFIISLLHVAALQLTRIDDSSEKTNVIRFGLVIICAIIHIFTPFNMAEGSTKWRYIYAYAIETLEAVVLFVMVSFSRTPRYNLKIIGACYNVFAFIVGIFFMLLYYCKFHPRNRGELKIEFKSKALDNNSLLKACEPNLRHVDSDDEI